MARSDADALIYRLARAAAKIDVERERIAERKHNLIMATVESTAIDIIRAIREHGPTQDVIIPRLKKMIEEIEKEKP